MAKYVFHGKVLPTFRNFVMNPPITAHWNDEIDPPNIMVLDATITISSGAIEIVCESNLYGTDNYDGHVDLRANSLASAVVNCYAFAKGLKLDAILETVVKPDGIKYSIQACRPDLEKLVSVMSGPDEGVDITSVLGLVVNNTALFSALRDMVGALNVLDASVNCGRVVDTIRHSMVPVNDRAASWPTMRDRLNVSESYVKFITENSKGPRHGDVIGMTFPTIHESVRRSWIIMNRFLEFKKRGERNLPLSEFPLLDN